MSNHMANRSSCVPEMTRRATSTTLAEATNPLTILCTEAEDHQYGTDRVKEDERMKVPDHDFSNIRARKPRIS